MRVLSLSFILAGAVAAAAQAPAAGPNPEAAAGLQVKVTTAAGYNNNLRDNNQAPLAGAQYNLGSDISYIHLTPTGGLRFRYQPYFQYFPGDTGLDSLNQIGELAGNLVLAPRWSLSGQTSGGYMQSLPINTASGIHSVLSQQAFAATPRTREITANGQLALAYQVSPRLQASISGAYNQIRFPSSGVSGLTAVRQTQGGALLRWSASSRTQIGLQYAYLNAGFGGMSHLAAHSLVLSWQYALTPLTVVDFYGGPEFSQVHDTMSLALGGLGTLTARMYRVRTYPRVGGALTHSQGAWNWNLQASTSVSNGGGAMPFPAELVQVRAGLGPRLAPGWRLRLGTQLSQLTALAGGQLAGRLRMATAGLDVQRDLSRHLSLDVQYEYLVQRGSGLIPLAPDMNRSLALAGLTWSWRPNPLLSTGARQ